jgi:CRISPR/Cas system-associated endonuclease/helicase Cas3
MKKIKKLKEIIPKFVIVYKSEITEKRRKEIEKEINRMFKIY